MILQKEIDTMERNERTFSSIWSDPVELDSATLCVNRNFPDDLLFNRVIEVHGFDLEKSIDRAASYFKTLNEKPTFFITENQHKLFKALSKKGFRHVDDFNVMKLAKAVTNEGGTAKIKVVDEKNLASWVEAYMKAFGIAAEFRQEVLKRSELSIKDKRCKLYVALVDEKMVGTGLTVSEDGVTGFYCIGTLPEFRGRGIASQLLQVGIEDSKKRGGHLQCLQNLESDKVRAFYEKRGFETVFVKKVYQRV